MFNYWFFFLASNCGKKTTYNALRKFLGLGSATTISHYYGYLENSYLCFFVNRYNPSLKAQQQSPKNAYFTDHAFAKIVGFRASDDKGRLLENLVFIELKRRGKTIFYHRDNKECDFVILLGTAITEAIQVCLDLSDPSTRQRELAGLVEALQIHGLDTGYVLTESKASKTMVSKNNRDFHIKILPIWQWLLDPQDSGTDVGHTQGQSLCRRTKSFLPFNPLS